MTDGGSCPSCAQAVGADARFCHRCGAALTSMSSDATRKVVTVLFCDQSGSTALGESFDPEYLRTVQLRYFQLLTQCVERHGGRVEKYIGDAVMAVFGLPTVHEDDALRAVRAALDMRRAVEVLNAEFSRPGWPGFSVRIGVNSGEVVATADPHANQALVSGDTVNTAARLEQSAGRNDILLGELTQALTRNAVLSEPVPALTVKGKSAPVPAWRLVDIRPRAEAVQRSSDVVFYGRQQELTQLRTLFDDVRREPRLHLCTIYGEPGIGKSRLAAEFAAGVAESARVARGECAPYGDASLTPFAQALSDLLSGAAGEELRHTLEASGSWAQLMPVIRDGSAGLEAEVAFNAIRKAIVAAAAGRPALLVVDDLHWASDTTLDLIDYLCDRVFAVPVMLICLARLEFVDRRPQWGGGLAKTTIVLRPLPEEDCMRIAADLVDVSAHSTGTVSQVMAACDGNPLFIEQMMEMYRDGDSGTIPASLHALVAARLGQLDPRHREWLEFAAVLGTDFSLSTMAEFVATPDDVSKLVSKRLIMYSADNSAFRFGSQLIKAVTYAGMPKRVRAQRHFVVAQALERLGEGSAAIAHHLDSAYRFQREVAIASAETDEIGASAVRHFLLASRQAMARADPYTARPLLESAIAMGTPDSADLWSARAALADILLAVGDLDAAKPVLRQVANAPDPLIAMHGRIQSQTLQFTSGMPADLAGTATSAIPLFEAAGDALGLARCWLRLGQVSQLESQFSQAHWRFERALSLAKESHAIIELPSILGGLALSLWNGPEPARSATERCRQLLAEYAAGSLVLQAAINCPLAMLLAMRGEFDEAREALDGAEEVLAESGHRATAAVVPLFGGLLETMARREQEAVDALQAARDAFGSLADTVMRDSATLHLARLRLDSGHHETASALIAQCEPLADSAPLAERSLGGGLRARLAAMAGDFESAHALAATAVELSLTADSPLLQGLVLLDQADVFSRAGDPARAREAARLALSRFHAKEDAMGAARAVAVIEALAMP